MHQKFAFTTAAMAAALEDTPVSYEDLADIERQFDEAETEISECTHDYFHPSHSSPGAASKHMRSISFRLNRPHPS